MIYRFAEFTLDDRHFELRSGDAVVKVERRIFDLLLFLVRNRDRVVTKEEIFEEVWEGRRVGRGSLTVAMTAMRRALRDPSPKPRLVQTHHGRGYRFIAEVEEFLDDSGSEALSIATRFIGRRSEIGMLNAVLEAARSGARQTCLLSGEAGIGKTRLAEEFCQRARRAGAGVVAVRCLEEDGAPAFWPWIQALRAIVPSKERLALWPRQIGDEILRLVPELGDQSDLARPQTGDGASARFRLFDAVAAVLRASISPQGMVLFIDDVHRADPASLALLEFVAAQLNDVPMILLLAHRDVEIVTSELHRDALARITRLSRAHALALSGLSEAEVGELMSQVCDGAHLSARSMHELTGGNPFFVSQVAPQVSSGRRSREPLPSTVREAIARQVDGMSAAAIEALEVASVVGREFSEPVLAGLCGGAEATADLLVHVRLARLVESAPDGGRLRFRHALVRDVLYARLSPERRAEIHWKVADALEDLSAQESQIHEVAFHRYLGVSQGDPVRALDSCRRAGLFASAQLAYEDAITQLGRAIHLTTTFVPGDITGCCDLHLLRGAEQSRAGDRDRAAESFRAAAQISRSLSDGRRLALAAIGSVPGFFAIEAGDPDAEVIALVREAIAFNGSTDRRLRAFLLSKLAMALAWHDSGNERRACCQEAWEIAVDLQDGELTLHVLLARWFAEWSPEKFEARWRIADDLMVAAELYGDREALLLSRLFQVTCLLERGDIQEFERQVAVFEVAAEKLRQPEAKWYSALLKAMLALHHGNLDEAARLSLRFAEFGSAVRDANVFHSRTSHRVLLAWELADCNEMIAAASDGCDSYPTMHGWRAARAWAFARAGRLEQARVDVEVLCRPGIENIPRRMDWAVTMAMLGEACVSLQDHERARRVFAQLVELRGRLIVLGLCVATWGCASRYLGRIARLLGDWNGAESLLREAVEVDAQVEARAWAAWSEFELGCLLIDMPKGSKRARAEGLGWLASARRGAERHSLRWMREMLDSRSARGAS